MPPSPTTQAGSRSWLGPLLLGGVLLAVSNGRWIVPAATWLVAVPWLLFIRRAPRGAIPLGLLAAILVQLITWHGLIPAPGLLYVAIVSVYAVVYFLPLLAVRGLAPRLEGVAATLVFPVSAVGIEFLFQRFITPYGSWFSLAYTQTRNLPLLQVVSITGTAGITFLIAWCGAVLAQRWDRRPDGWTPELTLAAALAAVLGWGQLRLSRRPVDGPPLRTAGLVPDGARLAEVDRIFERLRTDPTEEGPDWDSLRAAVAGLNADLFRRTEREAAAGARLVAWSETAGRLLKAAEPDFLGRAGRLAREHRIYLAVAYGSFSPGATKPLENRVAVIDTTGATIFIADKAHPIVGPESPMVAPGSGRLAILETPFGRVSSVICHDLDFPRLLRQAGRAAAVLVIGPSDDWPAITTMHADMALVRAVEQGMTLFRPTAGGRSEAVTPFGERLAMLDQPEDAFVVILRPTRQGTVYAAVGDLFSWCSVVALAVLLVGGGASRRPVPPG